MSSARTALICACALVANAAAFPALVLPTKSNRQNKGSQMVREADDVVIRKVKPFYYPFNLFPIPKYTPNDGVVHGMIDYEEYKHFLDTHHHQLSMYFEREKKKKEIKTKH